MRDATGIFSNCVKILKEEGIKYDLPDSSALRKIVSTVQWSSLLKNPASFMFMTFLKLRKARSGGCRIGGLTFNVDNDGKIRFCHRNVAALPNILENPEIDLRRELQKAARNVAKSPRSECLECPSFSRRNIHL